MAHSKDTCRSCDKPLGNTKKRCHECGGKDAGLSRRGGDTSIWAQLGGGLFR